MNSEILENLKKAVIDYDPEKAAELARKAVEEKLDPIECADALIEGVQQIGDGYGRGELFLPDLVGASEALQSAMPIIQKEIKRQGKKTKSRGTVVIGTVFGDIHSIGKIMVSTLLVAAGFEVVDLGVNVEASEFVKAIKKHNPDILAMSALLTTTASEQKNVIGALENEGLRDKLKVMVGGGAITKEFADSIGADGYAATAPAAVELAKDMIGVG